MTYPSFSRVILLKDIAEENVIAGDRERLLNFTPQLKNILRVTKWNSLPATEIQSQLYQFQPPPCGRPPDKMFSMFAN